MQHLFIANVHNGTLIGGSVIEYSWPGEQVVNTFTPPGGGNSQPIGVAVTPSGSFH